MGLFITGLVAMASGTFTAWNWLEDTYAHRVEFEKYQVIQALNFEKLQNQVEQRILMQQKFHLEAEILKLEIKQNAYPARFDAVDKGVLAKAQEQLRETNVELKSVKEQYHKLVSGRP